MKAKKTILVLCAMLLIAGLSVAGTLAYLTSKTEVVKNTFTVGNIVIDIDETSTDGTENTTNNGYDFHIQPGLYYDKEPVITVEEDSENCYVFAYVNNELGASATLDIVEATWMPVADCDGLYEYKAVVNASDADVKLPAVFTTVSIKADLDNSALADLAGKTITVQAYAHQADGVDEATAIAAAKAQFGF